MLRSASRPAPLSTGRILRIWGWKLPAWIVLVAIGLVATDYGIGVYQRYALAARQAARAKLERMALFNLRAEVQDIAMLPGNQYRLTVKLDNPFPEHEFYVMTPEVQVYVQQGTVWREVPTRPAAPTSHGSVDKISGPRASEHIFEASIKKFEELIPGYMHVRISNVMYVSPRSEPQREEIVERNDNYYVYLKPPWADDRELLRKNQFPGGQAPVWIGMPPH